MIVEDDEGIRSALETLFELSSVRVRWASTGKQALELLQDGDEPPSLIVLDGKLPDTHGLELARKIRGGLPENSAIYLFSADSAFDSASPEFLKSSGIDGFIQKPFDVDQFLNLVLRYAVPYLH